MIRERRNSPVEVTSGRNNRDIIREGEAASSQLRWMRARDRVPPALDKAFLVFCSDHDLSEIVSTALGQTPHTSPAFGLTSSLDHRVTVRSPENELISQFFDKAATLNDWLLYEVTCEAASNGRGLAHARFWRRDGKLVAIVTQEVLQRSAPPWGRKKPGDRRAASLSRDPSKL